MFTCIIFKHIDFKFRIFHLFCFLWFMYSIILLKSTKMAVTFSFGNFSLCSLCFVVIRQTQVKLSFILGALQFYYICNYGFVFIYSDVSGCLLGKFPVLCYLFKHHFSTCSLLIPYEIPSILELFILSCTLILLPGFF